MVDLEKRGFINSMFIKIAIEAEIKFEAIKKIIDFL